LIVAHPRHPAAIAEDCARADIVVLAVPRPRGCTAPRLVLDFFDVRARGTHALYLPPPGASGAARHAAAERPRVVSAGTATESDDGTPAQDGGSASARVSDQPAAEALPAIRVATVAAARGDRPWSRLPWWAHRHDGRAAVGTSPGESDAANDGDVVAERRSPWRSRLAGFAASAAMLDRPQPSRAEAEVDRALSDPSLYDERW
jgi:hypothetical protein